MKIKNKESFLRGVTYAIEQLQGLTDFTHWAYEQRFSTLKIFSPEAKLDIVADFVDYLQTSLEIDEEHNWEDYEVEFES